MEILRFSRFLTEKKQTKVTYSDVYVGLHPLRPKRTRIREGLIDKVFDKLHSAKVALKHHIGQGKKHKELSKHYNKYTDHDRSAISKYSQDRSSGLNERLHYDSPLQDAHRALKKNMDDMVNRHSSPHDMHVYTSAHFNPADEKGRSGKHIHVRMKAYTSTTINHSVAYNFAVDGRGQHQIIKIHIPKGSRGGYIGHHSVWPEEREFVLPRNSQLHIHPEPDDITVHHPVQGPSSAKLWHAKLVHDGFTQTRHFHE